MPSEQEGQSLLSVAVSQDSEGKHPFLWSLLRWVLIMTMVFRDFAQLGIGQVRERGALEEDEEEEEKKKKKKKKN